MGQLRCRVYAKDIAGMEKGLVSPRNLAELPPFINSNRNFDYCNNALFKIIWALLKILLKKDAMADALKGITIQGNPIVNSSAVPDVIRKDKKKNPK